MKLQATVVQCANCGADTLYVTFRPGDKVDVKLNPVALLKDRAPKVTCYSCNPEGNNIALYGTKADAFATLKPNVIVKPSQREVVVPTPKVAPKATKATKADTGNTDSMNAIAQALNELARQNAAISARLDALEEE